MLIDWKAATLLLAAAGVVAACGGGADRTKAQLRLINASSGYPTLDLRVDDKIAQGTVAYGSSAAYIEVDPGKAASTISHAGSATPLLSFTPSVEKKKHYSVLAYGAAGALRQQALDDNAGAPDNGRALLRVINASADAGAVDVYLTGSSEALDTAVAVQSNVAYGTLGNWLTINSANWRLRVTAAGSKTDLRLDVPAVDLPSKHVTTLVLTPGAGGVLLNALLLAQQGAIARHDALHARVRLAAVVADSGTVAAQVGQVLLAAGVGSPVLNDYTLVSSGAAGVAVTVNGLALAPTSISLVGGRDYSLMVYGPPTAPQLSWIDDDNRLPSDGARAKLRLVNGLSDGTAPLAMSLDFAAVASGVGAGTASVYGLVNATSGGGTDGKLSITATGATAPLFTSNDQILRAGASYSVFLVGPQAAPVGIVRRDR